MNNNALVYACRAATMRTGGVYYAQSFIKYGADGIRFHRIQPWEVNKWIQKNTIAAAAIEYVNYVLDGKFADTPSARKIFAFGTTGKTPLEQSRRANWTPYVRNVLRTLNTEINIYFNQI